MDFNQIINRNNTGSVKWDFIERHFGDGAGKLLPMWVSDFDFACPPEVQAALHQRIEHGVFGYSERDEAYFNALLHWFSSRHQLTLKQEWVCSVEGVVPGLALLVQMLTHSGDGVVVQGPYYGSFAKIITLNGRKLLENPLSESPDDGYQMDFCQLERLFRHERPPLMILCNPHNPTGRCWSANELEQLLLLCEAYDVTLISDEIWADLLLPGETFTSVLHLGSAGINGSSPPLRPAKRLAYRRCEFLIFSFPILRFASVSCLVWTLMGWTSLTLSPFRRRLPHGMKADSGWIRYWITWRKTAAGLLNRRQSISWARIVPAQGTYLLWMDCKNWDWMTNS